ncbi:Kinesin heavy chain [Trichoglossum hirsutum]|uniref:Kinesin-like protein n=1 Tax=Trichoglossum hirsutum TaxID=265104 RepID=A0A9P8RLP2_9PEZI|nr:Kinesin heavy chain [Trichoglossum hirsutum]
MTLNLSQSREATGAFTFDRVFDMNSRQSDVFNFSIQSTVDDILNGYNGTVFAYGQTGAGKSYTMMGSDIDNDESRGIIPRIVEQIFASILASPENIEYTVRVSYMEIYMERIRDLLAPQNDNLPVHEEKNRGVYVKGLLEIYVSSVQEVYEVMRRGGTARAVAATNMNQESSRSHSIFVITITQKNVETGSAKSGQLFLVDLAGSEKVGKTGASGQTLEEAKKINKSLSALGMVINSLTDGKSTHIPYRDSKLTRILQESLGGNSRTTLIINCSPSSYNDAETLSTLRFGVRAKAIKNKAKINVELSPAELKALLRKSQTQVATFENYIASLEGEVQLWRTGEPVPKEKWASPLPGDGVAGLKLEIRSPRPGTPSRLQAELPSRPDSRMADRSSTPTIILDKDEREEFLRRENELQDQIAEKESQIAAAEKALREVKEELTFLKDHDSRTGKDNEQLASEVNELKMHLEKISFESKEAQITIDSFKEANSELTAELDEVKQQLLDVRMNAKETGAVSDEKEKKKAERMAKMMASFDLGGDVFSDNERNIRRVIEQVDALQMANSTGEAISPEDLKELRSKLLETQGIVRQAELALNERAEQGEGALRRREELEGRLAMVEREYEELLERNLSESDTAEVKARLEKAYMSKREVQVEMVQDLKGDMVRKVEENEKLKTVVEDLQRRLKAGGAQMNGAVGLANGKTVQQQIAEFDIMKKSLMRDLQNRCERVVELEISLDEVREQYNNVLRTSNNRAQQKKMAFLERNLEQLTHVQRQLVEQNSSLKKEVAIAERKLIARNERIQSLEGLLHDSQEKLIQANHRFVAPALFLLSSPLPRFLSVENQYSPQPNCRFEVQLSAVKERLDAAKAISARSHPSLQTGGTGAGGFNFNVGGSRIAKPLRGGGGTGAGGGDIHSLGAETISSLPAVAGFQAQESSGKRSSGGSWSFLGRS